MTNNNSSSLVFLLFLAVVLLAAISPMTVVAEGNRHMLETPFNNMKASSCNGTVEECMGGEKFEMDSETNRRMLASTQKYIEYPALKGNTIPCSRRGDTFNNCRPGVPANPYNRGCNPITGCRNG